MNRHLFLFGSGPPFTKKLAQRFVSQAEGTKATIAVIHEDSREKERFQQDYTNLLREQGIERFLFFSLQENPSQQEIEKLKTCTGIIIGGGNTEQYQQYIVDTEFDEVIQNLYKAGRPVAGFSAGALICPKHCVISPKDNPAGIQLYKKGLGLIQDKVISVHFDTWEEEFSLKIAMKKTNTQYGYGLDENAGIYFLNEQMEEKEGMGEIHFYRQKEME